MDQQRKDRLRQLIATRFGGDRAAFGAAAGLTKGRVSQLLDPDEPFGERAAASLTEKLALPDRWFEQLAQVPTSSRAQDDLVINQYEAGGAMGHGLILEDQPPGLIKSWHVDHEWLRLNVRHHTGIENLRIVTGFGPSMRGMFNPGDPLLCDCGVKTVDVDAVYFFRVDSHGFIKILQRIPTENGVVLRAKSKNPDYDPFDITEKVVRSDGFEVFGKILTVWKSEQL